MPSQAAIIVTGAAGFVGSHTVEQLLTHDYEVIGVDDFSSGKKANLAVASKHPKFTLHQADVTQEGALLQIAVRHRPAAIIHLAGLVSVPLSIQKPDQNFRSNVLATHWVAETARLSGCPRVVFASSASVYQPASPYAAAKLASETLLLSYAATYGITVRSQRYFNIYGPRQDPASPYSGVISIFAARLAAGQSPTIYGDGEQTRDFISVHDVARSNLLAATLPDLPTGIADICTGNPITLNRLVSLLARDKAAGVTPLHAAPRAGDIRHSCGDPRKAEAELRFKFAQELSDGLAQLTELS